MTSIYMMESAQIRIILILLHMSFDKENLIMLKQEIRKDAP